MDNMSHVKSFVHVCKLNSHKVVTLQLLNSGMWQQHECQEMLATTEVRRSMMGKVGWAYTGCTAAVILS